jgi:hypothetical protein
MQSFAGLIIIPANKEGQPKKTGLLVYAANGNYFCLS